jgi:hypothetical protein
MNDVEDLTLAPFALHRLSAEDFANFGSRQHEREATQSEANRQCWEGLQRDDLDEENALQESDDDHLVLGRYRYASDGSIIVNSMCYDDFRNRLVEHFDILNRQNRVRWPTRSAKKSNMLKRLCLLLLLELSSTIIVSETRRPSKGNPCHSQE